MVLSTTTDSIARSWSYIWSSWTSLYYTLKRNYLSFINLHPKRKKPPTWNVPYSSQRTPSLAGTLWCTFAVGGQMITIILFKAFPKRFGYKYIYIILSITFSWKKILLCFPWLRRAWDSDNASLFLPCQCFAKTTNKYKPFSSQGVPYTSWREFLWGPNCSSLDGF